MSVVKDFLGTKILDSLLSLFIGLLLLTLLTLPYLIKEYTTFSGTQIEHTFQLTVFLYLTAIPFFIILILAKRLCKNILRQKPFSESSLIFLKIISLSAFTDALFYIFGTLMILRNLLSLTLMIAAFMLGLVSLILARLVEVAIEINRENELTI